MSLFKMLHLMFVAPELTVKLILMAVLIVSIISHVIVASNFGIQITGSNTNSLVQYPKSRLFSMAIKIFAMQAGVLWLSSWLFNNLLWQAAANPRVNKITANILLADWDFVIASIFINWVVFTAVCLSFAVYRNYSQSNNFKFADILLPQADQRPWLQLYNIIVTAESYIRVIPLVVVAILLYVRLFESLANKIHMYSLLGNPFIIAVMLGIIFFSTRKHLYTIINILCSKQVFNFINNLLLGFLLVGLSIFIISQIFLQQIKILHFPVEIFSYTNIVVEFFHDIALNKQRIKMLFYSANIVFSLQLSLDLLLRRLHGYKLSHIYLVSLAFPVLAIISSGYFPVTKWLQEVTNTGAAQWVAFVVVHIMYIFSYKHTRHIFCFFGKQQCSGGNVGSYVKAARIKLSNIIVKIIRIYFICLFGYYMFSWVAINYMLFIAGFLVLSIVLLINIKLLSFCFKNFSYLPLKN